MSISKCIIAKISCPEGVLRMQVGCSWLWVSCSQGRGSRSTDGSPILSGHGSLQETPGCGTPPGWFVFTCSQQTAVSQSRCSKGKGAQHWCGNAACQSLGCGVCAGWQGTHEQADEPASHCGLHAAQGQAGETPFDRAYLACLPSDFRSQVVHLLRLAFLFLCSSATIMLV